MSAHKKREEASLEAELSPDFWDKPAANVAFRKKCVPGPRSIDAQLDVEQEFADAATILELVSKKKLEVNRINIQPTKIKAGQKTERLSQKTEAELAARVQKLGDLDARNSLVMANIGLVYLVVNQFLGRNIRYEDLVQEGIMGLIRATESFEPSRDIRFSTYAVYWIRAKIQRLIQKIDRDDMPTIVGAESKIGDDGRKRKAKARKISLERTSIENGDVRSLSDVLPSAAQDPEHIALDHEREVSIREILMKIADDLEDPRLKVIVEHRILTEEPVTLNEIGAEVGLSREGVRLIESKLLRLAKARLTQWRYSGPE